MPTGSLANSIAAVAPDVLAPVAAATQPPLIAAAPFTLHAAIGSLAVGGAERIVLDWAGHAARTHRVRLIVLRDASPQWPVPDGIEVIRLPSPLSADALERQGARIAASGNPVVSCHLLGAAERSALARGGAMTIPVVHNAREGWIESAETLTQAPWVIAVSNAAAQQLRAGGCARVSVVRHVPRRAVDDPDARARWRDAWRIPADAFVIGMIGGVKPQKAYPRALRVLAQLHARRDAWLVVLGGPVGRDGALAWQALVEQAVRCGLAERVRLPGFVVHAARALPAFDLLLNTSRYEGLSLATLEALAARIPVVASAVGGQGEIAAEGMHLLAPDADAVDWADAIDRAARQAVPAPPWVSFPSARVWTLMQLPLPDQPSPRTLFVTANLNAGGAQRSLVNLACALAGTLTFEIAVCGASSSGEFFAALCAAGIAVNMTTGSRDAFDHAEILLRRIAGARVRTVVFWNVDPKVKLLVAKRIAHSAVRLIDVSPGAYAFEELRATASFQTLIGYAEEDYYAQLHRLVLKYHAPARPAAKVSVVPNGVPVVQPRRPASERPLRRIVVSGRIAPSKFLLETVAAMQAVWQRIADAELHILGTAEPRHAAYAAAVMRACADEIGRRVFLPGAAFDAPLRLGQFDLALVIGHHQGSPNAVLEAMAAGLPVVANDSGGTREAVIDGRTGILLPDGKPDTIARGLLRIMADARTARRLAHAGHAHVLRRYSMRAMARAYRRLLAG